MSYARFGIDGSDVYILGEIGGGIRCVCGDRSFIAMSPGEMLVHVADHRSRGDSVPRYVDERLTSEVAAATPPGI